VTESLVFTPVRRVCGLLLVSVVLLAGCKVDARVDVRMRADGSGTLTVHVSLDADAVSRVSVKEPLAKAVPLADVRAAGWSVSAWKPASHGGRTITLTHDFTDQEDLTRRFHDLVGANGVLGDPKITRTHSWFGATESIEVGADLRHLSTGIRSDAEVAKALTNAGVNVDALDAKLLGELGKAFTLTIAVHAPDGETSQMQVTPGTVGSAGASSSQIYTKRLVLVAIGAGLLLLALVFTGASLVSNLRRRRAS
jgi:hypothetical protein